MGIVRVCCQRGEIGGQCFRRSPNRTHHGAAGALRCSHPEIIRRIEETQAVDLDVVRNGNHSSLVLNETGNSLK